MERWAAKRPRPCLLRGEHYTRAPFCCLLGGALESVGADRAGLCPRQKHLVGESSVKMATCSAAATIVHTTAVGLSAPPVWGLPKGSPHLCTQIGLCG